MNIYKNIICISTIAMSVNVVAATLFDSTKIYSTPGEIVRYYEDSEGSSTGTVAPFRVAEFKNSYWVDGSTTHPTFYPSDNSWKLVSKIVEVSTIAEANAETATGTVIIPAYNHGSAYSGGTIVEYNGNYFQSNWWNKHITPTANVNEWSSISTPAPTTATLLPVSIGNATVDTRTSTIVTEGTNVAITATACTDVVNFPTWNASGIYLAGDIVQSGGNYYKTRWWVSGGEDPHTAVNNAINIWDTPWIATTECPSSRSSNDNVGSDDSQSGHASSIDISPVIVSTQTSVAQATQIAASRTAEIVSPIIPPVIPGTPTSTSNPAPAGAPVTLPSEGYEFLRLVTEDDWNWMFPLRSGKEVSAEPCSIGEFQNCGGGIRNSASYIDTFTLDNFIIAVLEYNNWAAANNYKQFLNEGTLKQQAEEFIIFWAKSSRETSGSWASAKEPWIVEHTLPNSGEKITAWKGGLYWVEEVGYTTDSNTGMSTAINYVNTGSSVYPPSQGRSYYGRGIIQLSWNYNYGAFSHWLYDNQMFASIINTRNKLLDYPNLVADNGALAIMSGIWFWMTPQGAKPSSHDVVYGNKSNISQTTQDEGLPQSNTLSNNEIPTASGDTIADDVFAYRLGTVINIVNGGLECNKAAKWHGGPVQRVFYYDAYAAYFNDTHDVGAHRIENAKASSKNQWLQNISDASHQDLQSATCYNQKSYYGW